MQAWSKLEVNLSLIHLNSDIAKNTATYGMSQMGFRTFPNDKLLKSLAINKTS